ncbi:oviduct-specific glycoprotein-like [Cloeon dipterum]|uniref:oviduct-specific glycoprotein-like n=1 Tax=Cloeon dipterum TaxID=197152 RepID=UPI00321FFB45
MYFDFKKLDRIIDYWLLPAYHFEGPWSVMTAISSSYLRADLMVLNHLKILPPDKILLGIPTYYLPVVVDSTVKKIRLSSRLKVNFTPNQQLSTFRQLCEQAAKGGLTVVHNESSTVNSYAFLKNDFVSFESSISAVNKMRLVFEKNLAGTFVASITTDDYDGKACNCGNFHILRSINNALRGSVSEVKTCP